MGSQRALFTDLFLLLFVYVVPVTFHKLQRSGTTVMLSKYECHLLVDYANQSFSKISIIIGFSVFVSLVC